MMLPIPEFEEWVLNIHPEIGHEIEYLSSPTGNLRAITIRRGEVPHVWFRIGRHTVASCVVQKGMVYWVTEIRQGLARFLAMTLGGDYIVVDRFYTPIPMNDEEWASIGRDTAAERFGILVHLEFFAA